MTMTICSALASLALASTAPAWSDHSDIDADEQVSFFPTCASYDAERGLWVVPIHAWVFEPEADSPSRRAALALFRNTLGLADAQSELFDERAAAFVVDNERGQALRIRLGQRYDDLGTTNANGHLEAESSVRVDELPLPPAAFADSDPWVEFDLLLKPGDPRRMGGSVQFVRPRGLSVISDVDDTIKISQVTDKVRLLQNTFLEPYRTVPGMAAIFRELAASEAVFHYVSSSPWQLAEPIEEMLRREGFPRGSIHLKQFRWKDSSFFELFATADETKQPVLESLIGRFPDRRFLLLGDASERDPEIYAELARRYPDQVLLVCIRLPSPELDDPDRFLRAFRGVPRSRWCVFSDAEELREVGPVAAQLQRAP